MARDALADVVTVNAPDVCRCPRSRRSSSVSREGVPAPPVWAVATTGNVVAAAFNSRIDADPIAIGWMRLVVATWTLALLARGIRRVGWNRSLVLMGSRSPA